MDTFTQYVDVFYGCNPVDLPKRKGIAQGWRPIKGMAGNTTPAAVLPFGKMSCCAYSGAYPTGYGVCSVNSCHRIKPMFPTLQTKGFTHVHQSGTGFIDLFYNYVLVSPTGGKAETILSEKATCGYYSCRTASATSACTVTQDCAFHRFDTRNNTELTVFFSQYGLDRNQRNQKIFADYDEASLRIEGNTVLCKVSFFGVPVYFAMRAKDKATVKIFSAQGNQAISFSSFQGEFGVTFSFDKPHAETVLALSYVSEKDALAFLERDFPLSVEEVAERGEKIWNEKLSRVEIVADEEEKKLFYSNLYHTLIKPSDVSDGNFYGIEGDCVTDLATLWDMYKTDLPFLFSLYPEIGTKVIQTLLSYRKKYGVIPNSFLIGAKQEVESGQAKFLAALILTDGYLRGIGDKQEIFQTLYDEYFSDHYKFFRDTGEASRTTHTMDLYEASACLAFMADEVGKHDLAASLRHAYKGIEKVFHKRTGLLLFRSAYYEGNFLNYSFRLLSDPELRIRCAGGKEKLTKRLDYFFAFRFPRIAYGKFEGFNNETDMEAPYCYHFVGRQDRLCEVLLASRQMWVNGRGGMPGNNDTGGLSSLFLWNAVGIFPVAGQNKFFIGLPRYEKVVLHLPSADFVIRREGEGFNTKKAVLNGQPLCDFEFSVTDFNKGGELVITVSPEK